MDIRSSLPPMTSPLVTEPPRVAATEAVPRIKPAGDGLAAVEVALVVSASDLAQGSSVANLELLEPMIGPEPSPPPYTQVKPRAIQPQEMEKVLSAYNQQVKTALQSAAKDSPLDKFETSLRLISNLKDPRLKDDRQAFDVLNMRKTQVEEEYRKLAQSPEVKSAFENAQQSALKEIFGNDLVHRSRQQAAYLLSDSFQTELNQIPAAEIQAKVQQELSALSVLNPPLAEKITNDLLEKTVKNQSLRMLQSESKAGAASRESLADGLKLYLKAQQTAAGISMQATNISRLASLSDEKIAELTHAVADLAKGSQAADYQKLAESLLDKVDELPAELQQDASQFLSHMKTQNALGVVLLAGSVAGLLQRDLPKDPKAWASLTSASLGTVSMSHFAFRLVGLSEAADVAGKINFKASLNGLKIPVLGSMVVGINTTLDAIALADEYKNEDIAGMTSRAMGVGSGLATLAAITVASGPAAPVILIGSTVVGLTAWGIDSMWGETDLTGRVRQDLRQLGLSNQEEETLKQYTTQTMQVDSYGWPGPTGKYEITTPISRLESQKRLAMAPLSDRVQVINQLMDQATNAHEESLISDAIHQSSDQDFIPLMNSLNTARLAEELEKPADLLPIIYRIQRLAPSPKAAAQLLEPMLQRLAEVKRYPEMKHALSIATPEIKQSLSAKGMQQSLSLAMDDWFRSGENRELVSQLLQDPDLQKSLLSQYAKDMESFKPLLYQLNPDEIASALKPTLSSAQSVSLLESLYAKPPSKRRNTNLTELGHNQKATEISIKLLSRLNDQELQAMPAAVKAKIKLLFQQGERNFMINGPELQKQMKRL